MSLSSKINVDGEVVSLGVPPEWVGVYLNPSTTSWISQASSWLYRGGGGMYAGRVVVVWIEWMDREEEGSPFSVCC